MCHRRKEVFPNIGKTGILTTCRSESPENFVTEIGRFDYVVIGATRTPNFMGIDPVTQIDR